MQRFTDKVALITGAASGIGRATAIRLAEEGASIMLADINTAGLEETAAGLPEGCHCAQLQLDVSNAENCAQAVDQTVEQFGRLDVLCNIAGIPLYKHLADVTEADWSRIVGINLNGVFFMCQAAMPHLLESQGNIINMSSSAGIEGQAYNSGYCATKGAVLLLSKSLAMEFAAKGVRVNAVCPGAVATPLSAGFELPGGADPDLMQRLFPLIEMSQPEEIAAAIAYLASEEARFVTGVGFPIDGGQTAG
jgi:meso-butanediol dehydrogenase/(S,S)-butanediol dehydrogenase/diacetyl reductase